MNIQNNGGIPLVGQPQLAIMQATVVMTPELLKKLNKWCDEIGLPQGEIGNTIFRLGLIHMSIMVQDEDTLTPDDTIKLIPLTDNEKKAFGSEA